MNLQERIISHVLLSSRGCLIWDGCTDRYGYGKVSVKGKKVKAHRAAYEAFVGPIGIDLVLDHLCRNRACVNPLHLDPVTMTENTKRGFRDRGYKVD